MKKLFFLCVLVLNSLIVSNLYSIESIHEATVLREIASFKDFSVASHNTTRWTKYLAELNKLINSIFYAKQNSSVYRKLAAVTFGTLKELIDLRNNLEENLIFSTFKHKEVKIQLIEE